MQWWAWIAIGVILLGAELTFVDAQFFLVFVGGAALIVGMLKLAGALPLEWMGWLTFAALAAISLITFRRRIYERMRRNLPAVAAGPAGDSLVLGAALAPGESTRLEYRGSSWGVLNGGSAPIAAGGKARIERVDGLTLVVHAERP
jgi:membrane protein implicated in regulation of membrane protease activity